MAPDPFHTPPVKSAEPSEFEAAWLTPAGLLPISLGEEQPTAPPIFKRYALIGALALAALVGAVVGVRTLKKTAVPAPVATPAASRAIPVETFEVERVSSYTVSRLYTGKIAALRSSDLGFERSGQVVNMQVSEGEQVSAGQALAALDTQDLEAQKRQLIAQKAQAQARLNELQTGARPEDIAVAAAAATDLEQQLALQQTQQNRREYLFSQGAITREQLDEYTFGTRSLQAKLDQARSNLAALENGTRSEQVAAQDATLDQFQAQIDALEITQNKSTLTAPFSGVIAERAVDEGTVVSAGQTVVALIESAAPEARIGVPSEVASTLAVGSTQSVRVNDQPFAAEVKAVLPEVDVATRTQTVVLGLAQTAFGAVEPGQTVQWALSDRIQAEGFWLPVAALTEGIRGLWTCYVLVPAEGEPGAFEIEARSLEIIQQESTGQGSSGGGALPSENRVLVRGTLKPGDTVVANGVHRLVPGQQVQPVKELLSNLQIEAAN